MTSTVTAPEPAAQPSDRPSVCMRGVRKSFDGTEVVRGIDLDIGSAEFFTMLGPSGCGKTTTLRMIAGFEDPSAGELLIDGDDVVGLPAYKRPTNTVFQSYALFPNLTVAENVAFGLKRRKVPRTEIAVRVKAELARVGLDGAGDRRPAELSGGMQQRVALARALVNLPRVLLLDEPLGALDLKLRKTLQVELKRIQREVGITFVYVTHDQEEALTMSDRIAVMHRGRLEHVADPVTVYERPATTFVAGFIGVSNLMPAQVVSVHGERARVRLDAGVELETDAVGIPAGERCHAVVRPEKLAIGAVGAGRAAGTAGVDGLVESSVFLGTATQLVVRLAGETRMTVLVPNADEATRGELPGGGASICLSWRPEHVHLVRESPEG